MLCVDVEGSQFLLTEINLRQKVTSARGWGWGWGWSFSPEALIAETRVVLGDWEVPRSRE